MKRQQGGDASFLIGIILGFVVGAAVAVVLNEAMQGDRLNVDDREIKQALASLESAPDSTRARVAGASEGVANP